MVRMVRMRKKSGTDNGAKNLLKLFNESVLETQVNGGEIVYFSGKYIGKGAAERHMKNDPSFTVIDILKRTLAEMGIADVCGIKLSSSRITLDISNCALCGSGKGGCRFLLGVIAGIAGAVSGKSYSGEKIVCGRENGSACAFSVSNKN